jgi:DNA topoisomerase-1
MSMTTDRASVAAAIEAVARRLSNTRADCRKCYVHPAVLTASLDGSLTAGPDSTPAEMAGLTPAEATLLTFLQGRGSA